MEGLGSPLPYPFPPCRPPASPAQASRGRLDSRQEGKHFLRSYCHISLCFSFAVSWSLAYGLWHSCQWSYPSLPFFRKSLEPLSSFVLNIRCWVPSVPSFAIYGNAGNTFGASGPLLAFSYFHPFILFCFTFLWFLFSFYIKQAKFLLTSCNIYTLNYFSLFWNKCKDFENITYLIMVQKLTVIFSEEKF